MFNKKNRITIHRILTGLVTLFLSSAALATPITENGLRLATQLDSLHVEQHWPAGVHVNWENGEPDGRRVDTGGKHTHCSAFVASAAKSLGIYILRPPEHSPILLANAQFDWLAAGEANTQGWVAAESGVEAQALANQGNLVVAVYKNRKGDKPGHIAIVRPDTKSDAEIVQDGPQITQAGLKNFQSASLKIGFAGHPGAFVDNKVRYYAHPVSLVP